MTEVMLVFLFFMCAGIMALFVKAVDRFIAHTVIPEPGMEAFWDSVKKTSAAPDGSAEKKKTRKTGLFVPVKGMHIGSFFTMMLDKWRGKSKVMHSSGGYTVQIGSAHPTQIRIHHHE